MLATLIRPLRIRDETILAVLLIALKEMASRPAYGVQAAFRLVQLNPSVHEPAAEMQCPQTLEPPDPQIAPTLRARLSGAAVS